MLEFGNRNIIAMNYSRYVALPKEWVNTNSLQPGDKVSFSLQEDGTLRVSKVI